MQYAFVLFIFIGAFLMFIGWYIKKSKKIELLSQYSRKKKYNRTELAKFAGGNFFALGLLVTAIGAAAFTILSIRQSICVLLGSLASFLIVVIYFALKVALGVSKYEI